MNLPSANAFTLFYSLPNDKILDWSKFKAFADIKIKELKMMILVLIGLKTLLDKEKMLVTSIFSFTLNVFKRSFTQGR